MHEQTKRIDTFDIAKGLVILLVILGHMMWLSLIPSQWIFSFHMPFFFIMSGLFFNPQKYNSWIEYLTLKTRTLLIPSTLLTLLLCAITESLSLGYDIPKCLFIGERLPIVWFLFTLFFTEIIYYFISKVISPYRFIRSNSNRVHTTSTQNRVLLSCGESSNRCFLLWNRPLHTIH